MVLADYNDKTYDYTKYWEGRGYENEAEFIALMKLLPKDFDKSRSVIDIGGGFGRLLPIYKERFGKISIFDYSQKLLEAALENADKMSLNIKIIKGDVSNVSSLVNEPYDYVSMIRVSHHLDNLEEVFREVNKILKQNGVFILEIANKMHFKSVISNLLRFNFGYFNKKSLSVATKDVTFLNHHPKYVEMLLERCDFKVVRKLSVSNLRNPYIKKILPIGTTLFIENIMQNVMSSFYFGPSIFYKIEKK